MNIGDYVRTRYSISKCIRVVPILENSFMYEFDKEVYEDVNYLTASELKKYKSSPNIIDLIEYDDVLRVLYDNEEYICKVVNVLGNKGVKLTVNSSVSLGCLEIKSIVTKEQFESMKYKVGD